IFSTTTSQLALSYGSSTAQWTFRNAGANLYLATTTVDGTATTSTTALTIISSSGNVGIATSSPWRALSVAGTVGFNSSLGTGVGGNYLCIDTTTFEVLRGNGTACTASSLRFKDNVEDMAYGLDEVLALRPVSFTYKSESNMGKGIKLGFIAEEMYQIMPEMVSLDNDGRVFGLDYPVLTSVLTKAIQELHAKFTALSDTILAILDRLTGHDEKIATLEARVAQLEALVSGTVTVTTVMPTTEPITSTSTPINLPQATSTATTTPSATPLPAPEPAPEPTPSPETESAPTPEPASTPEPEPTPEPTPAPSGNASTTP
ncbi:MAG: tail fiber domain-containing protein, partial [Patescibacteria group bacterium]